MGNSDGTDASDTSDASDAELIAAVRGGDDAAYGRLWARHHAAARAAAVAVTATFDPDDLVQEAFASILSALRRGKGPQGAFRPYLLASVRNIAASWGRRHREDAHDAFDEEPDPRGSDADAERALDRGFTGAAFASLPPRWQEVLWYGEVEQLKTAEVARILGMTPNATAQLASRAREGLRQAWVQAHLRGLADHPECRATVAALGGYTRGRGTRRERRRIEAHLVGCTRCFIVAEEARDVSGRLGAVLLPPVLGAGAASYGAWAQGGGTALAAEAAAGLPVAVDPASGGAGSAGGSMAAGSSATAVSGTASAGLWVGVAAAVGVVAIAVAAAAVSLAPADADADSAPAPEAIAAEETDADIGTVPAGAPAPLASTAPAAEPVSDPPPATAPGAPIAPAPPLPPALPAPMPSPAPTTPSSSPRPTAAPAPTPARPSPEPTPASTPELAPVPTPTPVLPEGTPMIGAGSGRWSGEGLVLDLGLEGAPDAEVTVRIGDRDPVRAVLDPAGRGRLDIPVTARDLLENAIVRFAYVSGSDEATTEGPAGEMRLWALLRQDSTDITNG
ncbi:sigma-70 family RNA polymerase sigma factor [Microbacterium sp. NPDC077184]|uniref:RNA polymerase sigma factor n=1 Tax=Microbacterium sp. NPDC077184 TaxID=3154764 RepID=UPI00343F1D2A